MELFFFKDLLGRHNAFKIRGHIMGKVEWPLGGCLAFIQDSSLLSKGPWPLLPSSGIREPTAAEVTPCFWPSMLDLPFLGLPHTTQAGRYKRSP